MADQPTNAGTEVPGSAPGSQRAKRPYVRKSNNNTPSGVEFPTSPPQISDLAFNVHGWALEDGMKGRATFEVVNAHKATMVKGGFQAKIKEIKETKLKNEPHAEIYRTDLTYTNRETDETLSERDSAISRYLVVGYTLQEDDPIFDGNKTFARYSDNELVGESRPSNNHVIKWDDCLTPILVVTPIKINTGTSVRLFALIAPKSGLCQPVLIQHERIFYRWEFRASAGARYTQRNKNWNQLVIAKAAQLTPAGAITDGAEEDSDRPIKKRRSEAVVKKEEIKKEKEESHIPEAPEAADLQGECLILTLNLATLTEPAAPRAPDVIVASSKTDFISYLKIMLTPVVRGILTAIRASKTDRVMEELRSVLKVEVPHEIPLDKSAAIQLFSIYYSDFGANDATDAAEEIKELWPYLTQFVDVHNIIRLKRVMNQAGIAVGMDFMESFLSNALAYLATSPFVPDEMLSTKLEDFILVATALHHSQMGAAPAVISLGADAVYLLALLREIVHYHKWECKGLRMLFTDKAAIPLAFDIQTFEYNVDFDVGEAMPEVDSIIQELSTYAEEKNGGAKDVLLWLERLRLLIRQA